MINIIIGGIIFIAFCVIVYKGIKNLKEGKGGCSNCSGCSGYCKLNKNDKIK